MPETMTTQPPTPPVSPAAAVINQPVSHGKAFRPVMAVAAVLLISGLSFGAYQFGKNQTPSSPIVEPPTLSPTVSSPSSNPADPTANWKTYTNTKYGFSFKYPKIWESEEEKMALLDNPDNVEITFFPVGETHNKSVGGNFILSVSYVGDKRTVDYVKSEYSPKALKTEIGGKPALKDDVSLYAYIKVDNNNSIEVRNNNSKTATEVVTYFDQLLATFKFLGQASLNQSPASFYDFVGVIKLKGYLAPVTSRCSFTPEEEACKVKIAFFRVLSSDNTNFSNYLKQLAGNAYVTDDSISLGCLDESKQQVSSNNDSDTGPVESLITGSQYNLLLASSLTNPVNLSIERLKYTGGRQANDCYSHFRNFRVY